MLFLRIRIEVCHSGLYLQDGEHETRSLASALCAATSNGWVSVSVHIFSVQLKMRFAFLNRNANPLNPFDCCANCVPNACVHEKAQRKTKMLKRSRRKCEMRTHKCQYFIELFGRIRRMTKLFSKPDSHPVPRGNSNLFPCLITIELIVSSSKSNRGEIDNLE